MELEGRTRHHGNRSRRRIAILPTAFNKVEETALTLANKMARAIWALLTKGGTYRGLGGSNSMASA